jgi:ubiquitin C-terminal hydrolase
MDLTKVQGFDNMGNTCFMNSALQLLFRCSAFTKYMLNTQNFESKILKCYKITLTDYFNSKVNSLEPTIIKRFIADELPEFVGYRQHDAHEFIIHTLDMLDIALKKDNTDLENLSTIAPENIISKLFDCKLYSEIKSLETSSSTLIKEPDRIVTLPIPEIDNPTLDDCFKKYCELEILDGENMWFDEDNNKKVKAQKCIKICNCPKYFIIALKRYNVKNGTLYRMNNKVNCPSDWEYDKYVYHCRGFVVQSGGLGGGHYIAFIKQDDKWYCCNDNNVSEVSDNKISEIIQHSYILLYVKQKNSS